MKILMALLFLLASAHLAHTKELTITYLVYRSSMTSGQLSTIRNLGYVSNSQPLKITSTTQPPNTNYVLVTVTTKAATEETTLSGHESVGRVKRLKSVELVSEYDGRFGGVITTTKVEDCASTPDKYVCLPKDFYRNWAVNPSTP